MSKILLANIFVYGRGLLFSRVLGLFRDVLIGLVFGVGAGSDILLILLTVPDFLAGVLLGSAIQLVLVPYFQLNSKKVLVRRLVNSMVGTTALSVFAFFLLAIFKSKIFSFFMPSYSIDEITGFTGIFGSYLILGFSSLMIINSPLRAFLHSQKRFNVLGLENIFFNMCVILGTSYYWFTHQLNFLFIFVSIGFISRFLWLFFNSRIILNKELLVNDIQHTKKIEFPVLPILMSSLFTTFAITGPVLIRSFINTFGEGWASKFIYANRFVDIGMMALVTVSGAVVFSELSEQLKYSTDNVFKYFRRIILQILILITVLGVIFSNLILTRISLLSDFLDIFVILCAFIPIRIFLHYFNLILMASNRNITSGSLTLLGTLVSFLVYKNVIISNSIFGIFELQIIIFSPIAILFMFICIKLSPKSILSLIVFISTYIMFYLYFGYNFKIIMQLALVAIIALFNQEYNLDKKIFKIFNRIKKP